ncbi:MAG: hypothetical protein ACI8PZ_004640 [Myxococcota bacterium]
MHPEDDRFRAFPTFDDPAQGQYARSRHRLGPVAEALFPEAHLSHRFARALGARRAVNVKELLESFEFHHRVRRRVRSTVLADLGCGHGLTGILFALAERQVERVILVDRRRPASVDAILAAAVEVAPWVADKVSFIESELSEVDLPDGAAVVAVHACGAFTDQALDTAFRAGGPVAVMPCCYATARRRAVEGLREALGTRLAVDVDRTYRMEAAGLRVQWTAIPAAITPMNRVMIGVPRG